MAAAAASNRSLRERVGALKNLRPFLMMVWRTSPELTAASLALRLLRAVMPVITLYVGKLIIDNVVLLVQAPHKPETLRLWLDSGVLNGLGLLLNQARLAFKAWFGVLPDVTPELLKAVQATF